jgi:hypothetical protein
MNITDLMFDYKFRIEQGESSHVLWLNDRMTLMDDEELEELEYGLTNILHAIMVYKRSLK